MKKLLLILTLCFTSAGLMAQTGGSGSSSGSSSYLYAPRLYIQKKEQQDGFLRIWYTVNFPGYVELHLIKSEWDSERKELNDRTLLIRGKVSDQKEEEAEEYVDYISFPVGPLEEGESYRFELKYKGKSYSGRI